MAFVLVVAPRKLAALTAHWLDAADRRRDSPAVRPLLSSLRAVRLVRLLRLVRAGVIIGAGPAGRAAPHLRQSVPHRRTGDCVPRGDRRSGPSRGRSRASSRASGTASGGPSSRSRRSATATCTRRPSPDDSSRSPDARRHRVPRRAHRDHRLAVREGRQADEPARSSTHSEARGRRRRSEGSPFLIVDGYEVEDVVCSECGRPPRPNENPADDMHH